MLRKPVVYDGGKEELLPYYPPLDDDVERRISLDISLNINIEATEKQWLEVKEVLKVLELTQDDYVRVRDQMTESMRQGLSAKENASAAVKMFPSYVRSIPDGTEQGNFLALDLGGTNFRVLLIQLDGKEVKMTNKIYNVPQAIMLGHGDKLFDHIADCLAKFVKEHHLENQTLPLGFTFSFPCRLEGLTSAYLVTWTKGFKCEGVEGEDVVRLLREAVQRRGTSIDVMACLNDTVGCLMAVAKHNHDCYCGVILGTGTNACYMEKLENVQLWKDDRNEPKQVIINMEWGAFGDDGMLGWLVTEYDRNVDDGSLNKGKQTYEKMISGMYMGEIVRQVLVKLLDQGLIFTGKETAMLTQRGNFFSKYVSEVESDTPGDYTRCREVLAELDLHEVVEADCQVVRAVCEAVSTRSAYLASAGIAAVLNKMGRKKVAVAVDGSLYRYHPTFHKLMVEMIEKLTDPDIKCDLMLSEDGSGKGAAIVASVAVRMAKGSSV